MFGLKRKVQQVAVIVPPPKPLAMAPIVGVESLEQYENIAGKLGFSPAKLLEEKLKRFIVEQGIPTYKYAEVDKYLTHAAKEQGKVYIWRPLREQDKPKGWEWNGHDEPGENNYGRGHGSYMSEWNYRPYDKVVPMHILQRVEKIQDRFKDNVLFFVSDYAVPDPDPFIMVTALDVSNIVFGVWDEPTFFEAKKQ